MARDEKLTSTKERPRATPRVDVYENEKEILLFADLPGVTKDALTIQSEGDTLTLKAKRGEAPPGAVLAAEYQALDFSRTFSIPPSIDREHIQATLEAGVLRLHLPKQAALTPRKIPVRVG